MAGESTRRVAAKEHWFRSALSAWADDVPSPFAGLTLGNVHRAAGRSERAFYGLWQSMDDFRAELLEWSLAPEPARMSSQATLEALEQIRSALEHGSSAPELIRFVAITDQQAYREEPLSTVQAAVIAAIVRARTDETVRQHVRVQYDAILDQLLGAYEAILTAWRRRPRHPWTIEEIATGLMYLADGGLLHGMFDRRLTDEQFADLVLALLAGVTEPDNTIGMDFDDFTRTSLRAGSTDAAAIEGSVASTVLVLYRDHGWDALHPSRVSAVAGVDLDVLTRRLGPLPDGFSEIIWANLGRTLRDLDPVDDPPLERVRSMLYRLRDLADAHPEATAAYLRTAIDRPARSVPTEVVAEPLTVLSLDQPAAVVAGTLVWTTLGLAAGSANTRLDRQQSRVFIDRFLVEPLRDTGALGAGGQRRDHRPGRPAPGETITER